MKRLYGFALLFAALAISWLMASNAVVKQIAVSTAGFLAAIVTAVVVTGGLCFLTQWRAPHAIAAALLRRLPRTLSSAANNTASNRQAQLHRTQG